MEKRLLSSITEEEATTVFALAFGFGPINLEWASARSPFDNDPSFEMLTLKALGSSLVIQGNGYMLTGFGKKENHFEPVGFNAYKVITYLASLGITFEQP